MLKSYCFPNDRSTRGCGGLLRETSSCFYRKVICLLYWMNVHIALQRVELQSYVRLLILLTLLVVLFFNSSKRLGCCFFVVAGSISLCRSCVHARNDMFRLFFRQKNHLAFYTVIVFPSLMFSKNNFLLEISFDLQNVSVIVVIISMVLIS